MDWQITNPEKKQYQCAEYFNVTQTWLSVVTNSDAFVEYRRVRMAAYHEQLGAKLINKLAGVAEKSLEVIEERIEQEREDISIGVLNETADMTLKALGYSSKNNNGPQNGGVQNVQNNFYSVDSETLARARGRMHDVTEGEKTVVDETAKITPPEGV